MKSKGWKRTITNFPTIDAFKGKKGSSIKSIDFDIDGNPFLFETQYKKYVDDIVDVISGGGSITYNGTTVRGLTSIDLDIIVPDKNNHKIQSLLDYANSKGVATKLRDKNSFCK